MELRVEQAQVLHRLEESPEVQEEGGKHADGHVAGEHAVAAIEEHDHRGEATEEQDPGAEHRAERVRGHQCAPVAVVEIVEDLLIARFTPERVHRADPRERLREVDDHQGDRFTRRAVGVLGLPGGTTT